MSQSPTLRYSPTKQKKVPLEEAYEDAMELVRSLRERPGSPGHEEQRRGFYGGRCRGWQRHFGLACEDLDDIDYQVSDLVTVEFDKRNSLRRQVACVRTHLIDAFDESTNGQTQHDRDLWGTKPR